MLTDTTIKQIIFFGKKKFKPSQISILTEATPSQIRRILNAKYVNKKKKKSDGKFRWEDFGGSVI